MHYLALATDYDGTLAHHGVVDDEVVRGLDELRASGRKSILVTGRVLPELFTVFAHIDRFDQIVAENGALLYCPATGAETPLATPPPPAFASALEARGVASLTIGRVIVATVEPHETTVLELIRDLGLELQVIFNKGAVMVLPSGINKATGLSAALKELRIPPKRCVAVGDAENDHALLELSGFAVAVHNALPALKDRADMVTAGVAGKGVLELIEHLIRDDLGGPRTR